MTAPLLNFRLTPELTAELNRVAAALGVTRSALMREAVAHILEQHQPDREHIEPGKVIDALTEALTGQHGA